MKIILNSQTWKWGNHVAKWEAFFPKLFHTATRKNKSQKTEVNLNTFYIFYQTFLS